MKKMFGKRSLPRLTTVLMLAVTLLMMEGGWWSTFTAHALSNSNVPLFGSRTSYGVGSYPTAIASGDFWGKGNHDLVTVNNPDKTVSVLLNNGTGVFSNTSTFALAANTNVVAVAVGDFNGDSKPDIAALDNSGDSHLDILLNASSSSVISFTSPVSYATGASTVALVVADLNGDGKLDIAALGNNQVTILLGQGDGTFQTTPPFSVSPGAKAIAAGDIDGDGKIDLVVTGSDAPFQILNNYSSGGSLAFGTGGVGTGSSDNLKLGDFNGDGKLDVVTISSTAQSLNVWQNNSTPHNINFNQAVGSPVNVNLAAPLGLAIADFNRDGHSDVAVSEGGGFKVSVLLNDGTGRLTTDSNSPYNVSNGISGLVAADFNGDGAPDLAFSDGETGAVEVAFNNDSHNFFNFSPAPSFTIAGNASHVAVGDFNGDGKLDAAVIGDTTNQFLAVLLGKGDGIFQTPLYPGAGNYGAPNDIAVGDFNGDGKLDIALAQFNAGVVLILAGNGDGTFQPPVVIGTNSTPYALAVADLNGDGKADIVTANYTSLNVTVLLNTTTVSQVTPSFSPTIYNTANYANGVAIGDFNGDGAPDLAISNGATNNTLNIFQNKADGTGTFTTVAVLTIPAAHLYGVSVADFNADGYVDIVAVDYSQNQVGVFLSNGDGTFRSPNLYKVGSNPTKVITADFNGDGIPDIATSNSTSQNISILEGDGDGTFRPAQIISTSSVFGSNSPFGVAAGDFDGDGLPDILALTATSVGAVFLNDTAVDFEGFAPPNTVGAGPKPVGVAVGDIDGDGKPDIVTVNAGDDSVTIELGNGQGGFSSPMRVKIAGANGPKLSAGLNPSGVGLGDISGSGKQDIVVSDKGNNIDPGAVWILGNTSTPGKLSFDAPKIFQVGIGPNGVGLGDIDRTGKPGIVTPNGGSDNVSVLHNISTPGVISFTTAVNYSVGSNPSGVGLGDIDRTGSVDIVTTNKGSNNISVLLNTGTNGPNSASKNLKPASSAGFALAGTIAVGSNPTGVGLGDISGSGKQDIVTANSGSNNISILSNKSTPGNLSFASPITVSVGSNPSGVGLGDISGSGKQDIVVSNQGDNTVSVLRGEGNLHFTTPITVSVGAQPDGVGLGDISGRGKLDIVTSNFGSNNVSVIEAKPVPPKHFGFAAPAVAGVNEPFAVTVVAQDTFSNKTFNFKGTVHFSSTDPAATLPTDYTYTAGDEASHVFNFVLRTVGSQTITATTGTVSSVFTIIVSSGVGINKLSVSTSNLNFQAQVGGTGDSQTLRLTAGPLTTNWQGSVTYTGSSQGWLTLTPTQGTLNAANSVAIAVAANPKGLTVGNYTTILKLQDTANATNTVSVQVTLNVTAQQATIYSYYLPFVGNSANGFTSQVTLQNVGNGAAVVTSQYFDPAGNNVGQTGVAGLAGCSSVAVGAACNPINPFGKGAGGTGVIVSNQPLAVIVTESTPFGGSAYAVTAGTSQSLVAPLAINNAGGFVTQLTVANAGAGTTTATVTFYDQHGNALPAATKNILLPAHASQTLDQTATDSGLPVGFYGWASIEGSAGSQLVAQVLETRADIKFVALANSQQLTANSQNQKLYAPAVFRNAFGGFVTGANIVNPQANPVQVTVTYYDSQGQTYPTTPFMLAAHALAPVYQGASGGDGLPPGGLPNGFYGSAVVSSQGGDIVMVVNEAGNQTASGAAQSGTYAALSVDPAMSHNSIGLPVMANGGGGFVSGATLLNTGDTAVTGTIRYYNRDGTGVGSAQSFQIAAHASLPVFQGAVGLPAGFVGQAIISLDGAGGGVMVTTNVQSASLFYTYTEGQ